MEYFYFIEINGEYCQFSSVEETLDYVEQNGDMEDVSIYKAFVIGNVKLKAVLEYKNASASSAA